MTGPESHHELDQELLSAYLDDELSAEERTAVEARLASDSSAAELLHQLRSVSQAVQALPQEPCIDDVGATVMARVSHAGKKSSAATKPAAADSPSSLSIGRTRRGWVWASLAIAAALLIMVMQEKPEPDNVAAVADRESRSESGTNRSRRLEFRSLAEESEQLAELESAAVQPPTTDAPSSAPLDGAVAQSDESPPAPNQPLTEHDPGGLQGGAAGAPMGQSTDRVAQATRGAYYSEPAPATGPATARPPAPPQSDMATIAADEPAAMPPAAPNRREGRLTDSLSYRDDPALLKQEAKQVGEKLVVVRVLARKDAIEAKAFDRLLERNGVEVVSAIDEVLSEDLLTLNTPRRRYAVQDQSGVDRQKQVQRVPLDEPAVEAVLVEAPEQTIMSCLESLNKDDENYLGVAVEDAQVDDGQVAPNQALGAEPDAKAAGPTDWAWTRYNRGLVPQSQATARGDRYSYGDEQQSFGGGTFGGRGGVAPELRRLKEAELSLARKNLSEAKNAKAVRLQTWGVESSDRPEQLSRGQLRTPALSGQSLPAELDDAKRQLSESTAANNDHMQVLFLLQRDESAAPSPRAKARAQ